MAEISKKLEHKLISHLRKDESENKKKISLHEKIINKLASDKAGEVKLNRDGKPYAPQGSNMYHYVRSKIAKGKDGYGKVISVDREKMMKKLGKDPGPNVVPEHITNGPHKDPKGAPFKIGTRSSNTADSNKDRSKSKGKK